MRHTLGASLNIRHNLSSSKGPKPLQLKFFFSSRRRHTRWTGDWSSDVCSSDLPFHEGDVPLMEGIGAGMAGGELTIVGSVRSEERRVGKECRTRRSPEH